MPEPTIRLSNRLISRLLGTLAVGSLAAALLSGCAQPQPESGATPPAASTGRPASLGAKDPAADAGAPAAGRASGAVGTAK